MEPLNNRTIDNQLPTLNLVFDCDHPQKWITAAGTILDKFRPELRSHLVNQNLEVDEVSGGITNKLLAAYFPEEEEATKTLIRVYGAETEKIIDRAAELQTICTLNRHDCAAKIYGIFNNGMCYQYVVGVPLTVTTIRQPEVVSVLIRKLVQLHCVYREEGGNHPQFDLFCKMWEMFKMMPKAYDDPQRQKKFDEYFPQREQLGDEIRYLEDALIYDNSPKVFCHNDLLCGNVLYDKKKAQVNFIDFEYAGLNYSAYDLANHFNEFAGVEDIDYSRFPGRDFQLKWLRSYLQIWHEFHNNSDAVSDAEIEQLYASVTKFTVVSHLFWVLWGFIQAQHSTIDFDFLTYAKIRFEEYQKHKMERIGRRTRN